MMSKKTAKTKSRSLGVRRATSTPAPKPPVAPAPPVASPPPPDFTAPPPANRRSSLLAGVRSYAEKHLAKGRPWWNAVVEASDDDLFALIGRARTLAGATGAVWRKQVQPLKAQLTAQNSEPTR
jgi:hypothetical protein